MVSGAGPLTVFAPTNDAFAKIDQATLTALLENQTAITGNCVNNGGHL